MAKPKIVGMHDATEKLMIVDSTGAILYFPDDDEGAEAAQNHHIDQGGKLYRVTVWSTITKATEL